MFLEGCVILAPWNAVLTALTFFDDQYNAGVFNYMPLYNFLANIVFQLAASFFGKRMSFHVKYTLMNIILCFTFISLPFIAKYTNTKGSWILYIMVFVNGSFNAILQASVFGLGGSLSFSYTIAIMAGNGVVGLLIGVIRMFCLLGFGGSAAGEWKGTIVYFFLTLAIILGGVVGFIFLSRNKQFMDKIYVSYNSAVEVTNANAKKHTMFTIWKDIMIEAISVFMTFVITFLVFPGVALNQTLPFTSRFEPSIQDDWNAAILSTIFNLFDTLGRFLPIWVSFFPKNKLYLLLCSRYIFVVFFSLISLYPSWNTAWFMILNMVLFAFTNGFSSSLAMGFGPSNVDDEYKATAGNMMSFHLIFGIFIGTLGGKGVTTLLGYFLTRRKLV